MGDCYMPRCRCCCAEPSNHCCTPGAKPWCCCSTCAHVHLYSCTALGDRNPPVVSLICSTKVLQCLWMPQRQIRLDAPKAQGAHQPGCPFQLLRVPLLARINRPDPRKEGHQAVTDQLRVQLLLVLRQQPHIAARSACSKLVHARHRPAGAPSPAGGPPCLQMQMQMMLQTM